MIVLRDRRPLVAAGRCCARPARAPDRLAGVDQVRPRLGPASCGSGTGTSWRARWPPTARPAGVAVADARAAGRVDPGRLEQASAPGERGAARFRPMRCAAPRERVRAWWRRAHSRPGPARSVDCASAARRRHTRFARWHRLIQCRSYACNTRFGQTRAVGRRRRSGAFCPAGPLRAAPRARGHRDAVGPPRRSAISPPPGRRRCGLRPHRLSAVGRGHREHAALEVRGRAAWHRPGSSPTPTADIVRHRICRPIRCHPRSLPAPEARASRADSE